MVFQLDDFSYFTRAAGFEPAVPGLGGRCIIKAMLHAHLHEPPSFMNSCDGMKFVDVNGPSWKATILSISRRPCH